MKIAIDLNDVVRAFTAQFASLYKKNVDRTFDIDDVDIWTNNLSEIFPFDSRRSYLEFLYNDYAYELNACSQAMDKNMGSRMSDWYNELSDLDDVPDISIISTGEYDKTIGSTYFFLSKIATKIRDIHLYLNEADIWDKYDVLITANPDLLLLKPDNKVSVKINTTYNVECDSDFKYDTFIQFMNDTEIIEKINKKL